MVASYQKYSVYVETVLYLCEGVHSKRELLDVLEKVEALGKGKGIGAVGLVSVLL